MGKRRKRRRLCFHRPPHLESRRTSPTVAEMKASRHFNPHARLANHGRPLLLPPKPHQIPALAMSRLRSLSLRPRRRHLSDPVEMEPPIFECHWANLSRSFIATYHLPRCLTEDIVPWRPKALQVDLPLRHLFRIDRAISLGGPLFEKLLQHLGLRPLEMCRPLPNQKLGGPPGHPVLVYQSSRAASRSLAGEPKQYRSQARSKRKRIRRRGKDLRLALDTRAMGG